MAFRFGSDPDEMCYPFLYEPGWLCDFEIVTDELCGHLGAVLAALPSGCADIAADLDALQPLAFHLNGSIRGRLAVEEEDLARVHACLARYKAEVEGRVEGFVLPRGDAPVPQLHLARSACKKAIRLMVRIAEDGRPVSPRLPRLCNLLCNLLFTLTLVINARRGQPETPFHSKSYGRRG